MFAEPQGALIRPDDLSDKDDPRVLYFRSYLLIRAAVGVIGVVLPLLFIIGEVASVWAFGVAWLFSSWDLWKELIRGFVRPAKQAA